MQILQTWPFDLELFSNGKGRLVVTNSNLSFGSSTRHTKTEFCSRHLEETDVKKLREFLLDEQEDIFHDKLVKLQDELDDALSENEDLKAKLSQLND